MEEILAVWSLGIVSTWSRDGHFQSGGHRNTWHSPGAGGAEAAALDGVVALAALPALLLHTDLATVGGVVMMANWPAAAIGRAAGGFTLGSTTALSAKD